MPTLASELRSKLERVVVEARDAAEAGARAALEALAVDHHEPYPHMSPAQRELRNHLRARARQLALQAQILGGQAQKVSRARPRHRRCMHMQAGLLCCGFARERTARCRSVGTRFGEHLPDYRCSMPRALNQGPRQPPSGS